MNECYVRGSTIKYLRIPDEVIDMVKDENTARMKAAKVFFIIIKFNKQIILISFEYVQDFIDILLKNISQVLKIYVSFFR